MKTASKTLKGGAFLIEEIAPEAVFTPEDFDDEIKLIAQTTSDFIKNEVVPVMERLEKMEPGLNEQLMKKAGELGLLSLEIPEAYGGANLSKAAATVVAEFSAGSSGFNTTISAHSTIGTLPIVYFGTEAQKKKYLPKLGSGEWIGAYALTEPEAGSDALGGKTTAKLASGGKHYMLNGTKMWISNAGFAKLFIVFAKVDGERKKFSAFLVEREWEGVTTGAEEKKMGIKSSSTRQVMFDNVKVPVENLLGEIGDGAKIAFNILNTGRFKLGASCAGAVKQLIGLIAGYALERHQFGVPIASFGLIQEKLAEMALRTYAIESAVYRTIGQIDQLIGDEKTLEKQLTSIEEYAVECSAIKVLGSELIDFATDEGVQIHGGYGYSADYAIEKHYRDARINRIYEGTNEINRLLIPGMLVKRAMKGHLDLFAAAASARQNGAPSAVLQNEAQAIAVLKRTAVGLLGLAAKSFGEKLERQQELLARIADIIMVAYAAESALLRVRKLQARGGKTTLQEAMVAAYTASAVADGRTWAQEAVARIAGASETKPPAEMLAGLAGLPAPDTIALRRTIAEAVLKARGYPSGR